MLEKWKGEEIVKIVDIKFVKVRRRKWREKKSISDKPANKH